MELHCSEPAWDALGTRFCIQICKICKYFNTSLGPQTAYVVRWSELLATDPKVPGSIPGPTTFTEK
jgi:hypothetical protein